MKRVVKYWAIRLLGREFMSMSPKAMAVGLWFILSLCLSTGEPNEEYGILAYIPIFSFIASGIVIYRMQNRGEI